LVNISRLGHVLDVLAGLLERDVAVHVETLFRDPGVNLPLPRIIRREHQSLIAFIAFLQIIQVPGAHPDVGLRTPVIPRYAAALRNETGGLRLNLHEPVCPLGRFDIRVEAALGPDHRRDQRRFDVVLGRSIPDGFLVLQRMGQPPREIWGLPYQRQPEENERQHNEQH
jgi:hypothetical protein